MSHDNGDCGCCNRFHEGFVLIEVMAAVVLVGVVVSSLVPTMQRAVDAAVSLRREANQAAEAAWKRSGQVEWGWGECCQQGVWMPGPSLELSVCLPSCEEGALSVWRNGWLVGEWPVENGSSPVIGQGLWSGFVGEEVTVRVRCQDGGWGVPWRSVVPDAYGDVSGLTAEWAGATITDSAAEEAVGAVHVLGLGEPEVYASWSAESLSNPVLGLVYLEKPWCEGVWGVNLGDRAQWWSSHGARRVDVYF